MSRSWKEQNKTVEDGGVKMSWTVNPKAGSRILEIKSAVNKSALPVLPASRRDLQTP